MITIYSIAVGYRRVSGVTLNGSVVAGHRLMECTVTGLEMDCPLHFALLHGVCRRRRRFFGAALDVSVGG